MSIKNLKLWKNLHCLNPYYNGKYSMSLKVVSSVRKTDVS